MAKRISDRVMFHLSWLKDQCPSVSPRGRQNNEPFDGHHGRVAQTRARESLCAGATSSRTWRAYQIQPAMRTHLNALFDKRHAFSNGFRVLHPESIAKHGEIAAQCAETCSGVVCRITKRAHLNRQSSGQMQRVARDRERRIATPPCGAPRARRAAPRPGLASWCCITLLHPSARRVSRARDNHLVLSVRPAHAAPTTRRRSVCQRSRTHIGTERSRARALHDSGLRRAPEGDHLWHAFIRCALQIGGVSPLYVISSC
jgi:hypothetical protein